MQLSALTLSRTAEAALTHRGVEGVQHCSTAVVRHKAGWRACMLLHATTWMGGESGIAGSSGAALASAWGWGCMCGERREGGKAAWWVAGRRCRDIYMSALHNSRTLGCCFCSCGSVAGQGRQAERGRLCQGTAVVVDGVSCCCRVVSVTGASSIAWGRASDAVAAAGARARTQARSEALQFRWAVTHGMVLVVAERVVWTG